MIVDRLRAILGDRGVLQAPGDVEPYRLSPACACEGEILCVARPSSTREVADVVALCRSAEVPIVPRGGGTGRAGGALPVRGEAVVMVSLERMRAIRSVDPIGNVIVADAGCTLAEVQAAAAGAARMIGLDHGGAGSSQIGGNLATNAGGNNVIRYGMARDQVLGIEAVLADGSIVGPPRLLHKNNTGYDLRHLLMGSEGTLGIITAAALKMRPAACATATALLAIERPEQALDLLMLAREHVGDAISAIELVSQGALALQAAQGMRHAILPAPATPWVVLVECDSTSRFFRLDEAFEALLEQAIEREIVLTGVVAASVAQRRAMWAIREGIPAAMSAAGVPIVRTDTAVPVDAVPSFIAAVERGCAAVPDSRPIFFGHVGDGNIHFNLLPPPEMDADAFRARMPEMYRLVEDTALSLGGTVSAEHGIGQTKRDALLRMKTADEIRLMRTIRDAFDPDHLFNRDKIFAGVR